MEISEFEERRKTKKDSCALAIGLGRSYGDSSLNTSGLSYSTKSLKRIEINQVGMTAFCGAGVTIGELERASINVGLFPKVVPGTEFVTIGGAIASNIHGKSHQKYGSFGNHVIEISLLDASGHLWLLKPSGPTKKLFWATIGGMGLTGTIMAAKISLMRIETSFVRITEVRVNSLSEILNSLREFDKKYLYTVAWIDLSGDFSGRGIVSGANPAKRSELPLTLERAPLISKCPRKLTIPGIFPNRFINQYTVRIFNFLWFHKPLNSGLHHVRPYLHPLDSLKNWNRVFGKKGFIQYQIVIPYGEENFLYRMLEEFRRIRAVSFLAVVKSFGEEESRYLSFAKAGWTIAVDINASNGQIKNTLNQLDKELLKIGGRVYLTKDSRISEADFKKMYPDHAKWIEQKNKIDPHNFWQSDQGKRLGLC